MTVSNKAFVHVRTFYSDRVCVEFVQNESVTENKESDNNSIDDDIRAMYKLSSSTHVSNSLPQTTSPSSVTPATTHEEKTLASTRTRRKVSLSRRAIENIAYQRKSTFTSGLNGQIAVQKNALSPSAVSIVRKRDQQAPGDHLQAVTKLTPRTTVKYSAATTAYIVAGNPVNPGDGKSPNIKILRTIETTQGSRSLLLRNVSTKTSPQKIVGSIAKDFSSNDAKTVIEISDDDCSGQ